MDDAALLTGFEDATLPLAELTHRTHIRLAWLYLRSGPLEIAAPRFCSQLRRYAEVHGKTGLFHATVTWAYLVLVNERLHSGAIDEPFEDFAGRNPDLFDHAHGTLAKLYDRAVLDSPLARRVFLLPRPISAPPPLEVSRYTPANHS